MGEERRERRGKEEELVSDSNSGWWRGRSGLMDFSGIHSYVPSVRCYAQKLQLRVSLFFICFYLWGELVDPCQEGVPNEEWPYMENRSFQEVYQLDASW